MQRLFRLIFQNSIKKRKPHDITDATLGSSASSGTTLEKIPNLLLSLFLVLAGFYFFFILLRFVVHKKVHFLCVSYQYFDATFVLTFRSNSN